MLTIYTEMSDEQLVEQIDSGKYDCFPELISRMMPHIKSVALRWKSALPDTDDLVEEGVIAVFEAVKTYDSTKSSFKTFASLCVSRAVALKVKSATAGKRIPNRMLFPMEESEIISVESAEEQVIRKEEDRLFNKGVRESLTELEGNVLELFLSEKNYSDIADELGITVKSVDGALQRVRAKLRNKP